jgi:hypothetical protein
LRGRKAPPGAADYRTRCGRLTSARAAVDCIGRGDAAKQGNLRKCGGRPRKKRERGGCAKETAGRRPGCLATHIAWHDPVVGHRTEDAGILWLTRVARLNPATSHVIREWDRRCPQEWAFRGELLALLRAEHARRQAPRDARPAAVPA